MSAGALSHLHVAEVGSGLSAAYTAKLLADLGADVVKIESPQGDVTRDVLRGHVVRRARVRSRLVHERPAQQLRPAMTT